MGKEKKSDLNGVVVNQRLRKACRVKGIPLVRTEALLRLCAQPAALCPVTAPTWGAEIPPRSSSQSKHAAEPGRCCWRRRIFPAHSPALLMTCLASSKAELVLRPRE